MTSSSSSYEILHSKYMKEFTCPFDVDVVSLTILLLIGTSP